MKGKLNNPAQMSEAQTIQELERLRLEYACTFKEKEEAKSLSIRKQLGGGSKWRTWLVLFVILVGMFLGLYTEMKEHSQERFAPYVFGAILLGSSTYVFWRRNRQSKKPVLGTTILEITRAGVAILEEESKSMMPWSAFSDCLESPKLFVVIDRPKYILLVVPKRAFPDENSQNWFRSLAKERPAVADPSSLHQAPQPTLTGESVAVEFELQLSDYFDRSFASWRTWGAVCFMIGIFLSASIANMLNPPPHPVNSPQKVFFVFVLPFMFVAALFMFLVITFHAWLAHKKFIIPQQILFLESGIRSHTSDGVANVPWTTYANYKETRRSIILWRGQHWNLIPKRAFKSRLDEQNCLSLMRRNLRKSRWFLG